MTQKTKFKQTEIGMIPEDWEVKIISETSVISIGGTPKTEVKDFWDGKIKWASARDVANCKSRYVTHTERAITEKGVENSNAKIHPKDTIIITSRGTVGAIALLPEPMTFNQTCYGLQPKKEYSIMYIYYALKNSISKLKSVSYGTVFETITTKTFDEVAIPLPPLPEQRAIAKILSDLDSKIELNQQMNKTLEATGQAIFKHWFVDFEFPNEEGKPYKSSGGEMVYNEELGKEIPKGWKVGRLGDVGTFKNGVNYLRGEEGNTDFFIVNVRDIANNRFLLKDSLDKINLDYEKAKEYLLQEKDIIIARSACPGEVSLILGEQNNVIYSGFSIRYRLKKPDNWIYMFLVLQNLKKNLALHSVGTTLTSVNQETLKNMNFIIPSNVILEKFNRVMDGIFGNIQNNLFQIQTLSQLRDSLLPKLMSGKIRVPVEAEAEA